MKEIRDMESDELERVSIKAYKDSQKYYSDSPSRRNYLLEANYFATLALLRKGDYIDDFGL